jgi:hypothetical protein
MDAGPVLGFMLSLYGIWFLFSRQSVCLRCGGRGRHRSGCRATK